MTVNVESVGPYPQLSRDMHGGESFRVFRPFHDGNVAEADSQGMKGHDKLGGSSRSVFLLVLGVLFHSFPGMFRLNAGRNENAENEGVSFRQFVVKAGFYPNLQRGVLSEVAIDWQCSLIFFLVRFFNGGRLLRLQGPFKRVQVHPP